MGCASSKNNTGVDGSDIKGKKGKVKGKWKIGKGNGKNKSSSPEELNSEVKVSLHDPVTTDINHELQSIYDDVKGLLLLFLVL